MTEPIGFNNQTETQVQCAECHRQGLSSELACEGALDIRLVCPVCRAPFARYPQRAKLGAARDCDGLA